MKLRTALAVRLAAEPETGDGYWLVTLRTLDGREFPGVGIIDGEVIGGPDYLHPGEVVGVLVRDLWILDCAGGRPWGHRGPAGAKRPSVARTGRQMNYTTVAPRSVPAVSLPGPAEPDSWTSPGDATSERGERRRPKFLAALSRGSY